jgi:hypothetical protein
MSTALLQTIEAERFEVIRVFESDNPVFGEKYKFFTLAAITGSNAFIIGLYESPRINRHDYSAIYKELKKIGVKTYEWRHKDRVIIGKIK